MTRKFLYIDSSEPSAGVEVGDVWIDTSSTPVAKKCVSVDPIAFLDMSNATKEFFVPATSGTEIMRAGFQTGYMINAAADDAFIEFYVPSDFSSITAAVVAYSSVGAMATHRLNYHSQYCSIGEARDTHVESLLDQDTLQVDKLFYEQDISGILSSIVAGDYVGIKVLGDSTNVPNVIVKGIRFKYS